MNSLVPQKVPESGNFKVIPTLAKTVNQLIDALRASQIRESPNVRIERSSGGTYIHIRPSSKVGDIDDTWY